MNDNPIVAEVRASRKEILDAYDGDIEAMLNDMMKRQCERGRTIVDPAERSISSAAVGTISRSDGASP